MEKKRFDPKSMDINIRIDCQQEEELDLIVEALKEKFPKWQFDKQETFVLYRKDDLDERKGHLGYTAKVWINKEDQIKGGEE